MKRRGADPVPLPEVGPMAARSADRHAARADGSGRPVERNVTRPLQPSTPLIGVKPLFDGAVDEGGSAVPGDRPRARRARGPDAVSWSRRGRDRLPVVPGGRALELRTGHATQPGGERAVDSPRPTRAPLHARALGPIRTDSRRPTGATRRASASTPAGTRRRRDGDAGHPGAHPRSGSLRPRRHGARADRPAAPDSFWSR